MGNKIYFWGIILCMLTFSVAAYQQDNIVFDTPGWTVYDQYSDRQAFEKNGLFLDVRASTEKFVNVSVFAAEINGKVESEKNTPHYEAVIVGKEVFYIFVRMPHQDKIYLLTMSGAPSQLSTGKTEMKNIVAIVTFSPESKVVEAPWEKPLTPPEQLPLLTRHPIPWGWLIFWIIVGLIIWWRVKKRKSKKTKEHKSSGKEK